jgi:outer membrane protein OmpA-like peptidoglycan-associated protein
MNKHMKKLLIITSLILSSALIAFAQEDEKLKQRIIDAEYLFLNEEFEEALRIFKDLQKNDPDNANFNYRIGQCYQFLPFEAGRSIKYLEIAIKNLTFDYNEGSYKETQAPIDALYYLGNAYHTNGYIDEAIETYTKYRDTLPLEDIYNLKMVERQIVSCENAKEIRKNPTPVEISNVGRTINSAVADFNPILTGDGEIMYFTRESYDVVNKYENLEGKKRELKEHGEVNYKIYVTYKEGAERWSTPVDVTEELDTRGKCVTLSISADGSEMLLYRNDWMDGGIFDFKAGTIYHSKKSGDKWQPIEKIGSTINSSSWESHACISPDGQRIYFTSERKGGLGGLDIWYSDKSGDKWGKPVNIGPKVNTSYDEETPFILADGKTLYFSSEGHFNMGGFDVFMTKQLENGEWTEPQNLGTPINTTQDNVFYYATKDGKTAYYAIARHEGYLTFGGKDIYEILTVEEDQDNFKNVEITGDFKLEDGKDLDLTARVFVIDTVKGDTIVKITPNLETGKYKLSLPGGDYKVVFACENYRPDEKVIYVPETTEDKSFNINANLLVAGFRAEDYHVIKNIYFDYNSYELNKGGLKEVEKLYAIMNENVELYIEVIGHTDARGAAVYNHKLSIQRSRTVINYLVEKGIAKERFVEKGLGAAENVAVNNSESGRRLNRRVEVRILKGDDDKIITAEEEIPDELRFKEFNKWSVIVKEDTYKVTDKSIFETIEKEGHKIEWIITEEGYVYYFGDFKNKADASKALNFALERGFDARLVDYFKLNKMNKFVVKNSVDTPKEYTIQLKAVDTKMLLDTFELGDVEEVKTKDGYYRYTYKKFNNLEEAEAELAKVVELGFNNAFIIETDKLK